MLPAQSCLRVCSFLVFSNTLLIVRSFRRGLMSHVAHPSIVVSSPKLPVAMFSILQRFVSWRYGCTNQTKLRACVLVGAVYNCDYLGNGTELTPDTSTSLLRDICCIHEITYSAEDACQWFFLRHGKLKTGVLSALDARPSQKIGRRERIVKAGRQTLKADRNARYGTMQSLPREEKVERGKWISTVNESARDGKMH